MTPSDKTLQQQFEDCVERCADSLYRVAYRLTSNATLARELVQETYLNAWRNLESLEDPQKLRGWMFAILRNQYSRLIRKESKTARAYEHLETIAIETTGPEQPNEKIDAVQAAINELDEKHKLPILLVSMEGMSVEEAAEILKLPKGTVLSRLHRGRQKIKVALIRDGIKQKQ